MFFIVIAVQSIELDFGEES